jgi:hypothetical protein
MEATMLEPVYCYGTVIKEMREKYPDLNEIERLRNYNERMLTISAQAQDADRRSRAYKKYWASEDLLYIFLKRRN